jgi:hypothetical protein
MKFKSGDRIITRNGNKGTVVREAKSDENGMDLATWIIPHYIINFDKGNTRTYDVINSSTRDNRFIYIALESDLVQWYD